MWQDVCAHLLAQEGNQKAIGKESGLKNTSVLVFVFAVVMIAFIASGGAGGAGVILVAALLFLFCCYCFYCSWVWHHYKVSI